MGEFYLDVGICAPDGDAVQTLAVKVNAGAKYTVLPGGLLRELGWQPEPYDPVPWGWPLQMFLYKDHATGRVEYRIDTYVGEVKLRVDGKDYTHSVIYGAEDAEPMLGSSTVNGYLFAVDEANRRVIPSELINLLTIVADESE